LAQLLVRGIPPILHKATVAEVHFQTEHLGWNTDDFLVIGVDGGGSRPQLAGQVKRTFTVSSKNKECKKAIGDFWADFKNPDLFAQDRDRLVLVTLRGTNTFLEHFAGLLDVARTTRDAQEFADRLSTKGLVSATAINYCDEIRQIVANIDETSISRQDLWPFLRHLCVLSLDLNTDTHQTQSAIESILAHTAQAGDPLEVARNTWRELLEITSTGTPRAASYGRGQALIATPC